MTDTKWFFPTTQGGEESGLNEPGIEFFRQSGSLARETLQNSGDASDGSGKPVTVTFELLQVPIEQFPGGERLREIIARCRDYMLTPCKTERQKVENGRDWFDEALRILSNRHVPVLRIRDEHTTGLAGGEHDEDKAWFRLIKKQGSAAMHGAGGGTYGIGQRAPFAFSRLRTVFYSSLTRDRQHAFIGKTILSSFRETGEVFRPIGFWGARVEGNHGVHALRSAEYIPELFRRTTVGTDLYIMGFNPDGWRTRVVDPVVRNFFAAIQGGRLVVRLVEGNDTKEINATTIEQVVEARWKDALQAAGARKTAKKEVSDSLGVTRHYLKALTAPAGPAPFVTEHPLLGRLQLYVTLDPEAPSRTAFMRQPRILVYERTQNLLEGYAAVLLCEEQKGNEVLARMEDPAHSKWDRERVTGGDHILSELYAFVRESLNELARKDPEIPQDLPDLGRYLPEDDSVRPGSHQKGTRVRTNRMTEEQTARQQQPAGRKRATQRPKPPGGPQVLLLPVESGDPGELEGVAVAPGDGAEPGDKGSAVPVPQEGPTLNGLEGPGGPMNPGGVGPTGMEGPGPQPGSLGSDSTGSGDRQGTRGGPGSSGPEGSGTVAWQGTQAGTGPASVMGGSGVVPGGEQGPTAGSSATTSPGGSGLRALSQVSFRAWFSPENRSTHLLLRSTRRGRASLRLIASGEDSDYELQIGSAFDVRTGERFECMGDRILNLTFESGQRRELQLDVRPARRVALSLEVAHGA